MNVRTTEKAAFLAQSGWDNADIRLLAGDASNRRYDRLTKASGERAVLMDAPAEKGEDVRPFQRIADHLRSLGLSAPRILKSDPVKGFLLIEDLGDMIYARILEQDPSLETPIYKAAIDVLLELHRHPTPQMDQYSAEVSAPLAALAFDWYQKGVTGSVNTVAKLEFGRAMHAALAPLDDADQVLIQRDYHAENLIWLPERTDLARVGLLDFQDAMLGHPAYDLVSILQDARRDVSPEVVDGMIERFMTGSAHADSTFLNAYAVLGAQRNLRILGVFARLCLRDGKAHYVDLLPRVWGHIQTNLEHPALSQVAALVKDQLPAPTPEVLRTLKAQCHIPQMQ